MRSRLPILIACLIAVIIGCPSSLALADTQTDATSLLNRVYAATQRLSYTGTFIYQHRNQSETSRITKIVEGGMIREKLETLDGQPREVVRNGDDVVCYLPALATVRVDKYSEQNKFPAVLPAQLKELLENYDIRRGGMERVAGFDCDVLTLEPKDNRRYGHKLWVDVQTGMLIKAKTYDGRHEAMEQFTFSHLQIGGAIDRERVRSRFEGKTASWRVEDAAVASADGLAAISVFIETAGQRPSLPELSRQGAINVYVRQLGAYRITVVGEAPVESVRSIAQAVAYRAPK